MKTRLLIFSALLFLVSSLSSCYLEVEVDEPFVDVVGVREYETKDIIYQEFQNGQLVYEEAIYNAWLDIDLWNNGGLRARNVQIEVVIIDQYGQQSSFIHAQDIRVGETITVSYDTGFDFTNDYIDYEVYVYWD